MKVCFHLTIFFQTTKENLTNFPIFSFHTHIQSQNPNGFLLSNFPYVLSHGERMPLNSFCFSRSKCLAHLQTFPASENSHQMVWLAALRLPTVRPYCDRFVEGTKPISLLGASKLCSGHQDSEGSPLRPRDKMSPILKSKEFIRLHLST